jgi:hypothetical protein
VPFAASLACCNVDPSILLLAWVPFLTGVVSGALLRSWWSPLTVPLALALGTVPNLIVHSGGLPTMTDAGFVAGLTLVVLLALIPGALGATIGVPLSHEWERLTLPPPSKRGGPEQ